MLVNERISSPVLTTRAETSLQEAHLILRTEHIRRLPVVNQQGKLVGIGSESDILEASPSDVNSFSIWELNYLLYKVKIGNMMTWPVITNEEDTPKIIVRPYAIQILDIRQPALA